METTEKEVLQNALKEYLQNNDEDPEIFLRKVSGSIYEIISNFMRKFAVYREYILKLLTTQRKVIAQIAT